MAVMADLYRFVDGFLPEVQIELIEVGSLRLPADMVWCNLHTSDGTAFRMATHRSNVEPIKPPLPPEPPIDTIVQAGPWAFQKYHDGWYRTGTAEACDWDRVCRLAVIHDGPDTPVRLVPDPAAGVELPWHQPQPDGGVALNVSLADHGQAGLVVELGTAPGDPYYVLFASDARAVAAALLAAADAAEAVTS